MNFNIDIKKLNKISDLPVDLQEPLVRMLMSYEPITYNEDPNYDNSLSPEENFTIFNKIGKNKMTTCASRDTTDGLVFEQNMNDISKLKTIYNQKGMSLPEDLKQISINEMLSKRQLTRKSVREKIGSLKSPDFIYFSESEQKLFLFEVKKQEVNGTVDEKLETFKFKLTYFRKLKQILGYHNFKMEYTYLLNEFFKKEKYNFVLNQINKTRGSNAFIIN